MKAKEVFERAFKTFAEAFVAYLLAHMAVGDIFSDNGKDVLIALLASAGAAGISAVWNGVIQPLFKTKPPNPAA